MQSGYIPIGGVLPCVLLRAVHIRGCSNKETIHTFTIFGDEEGDGFSGAFRRKIERCPICEYSCWPFVGLHLLF